MNLLRAQRIRELGTSLWVPDMKPGDWHFNTHHGAYQFALRPSGRLLVLMPHFVEWHDAVFNKWHAEVLQARGTVAATLVRPGPSHRRAG